jgi:hypothetical protein
LDTTDSNTIEDSNLALIFIGPIFSPKTDAPSMKEEQKLMFLYLKIKMTLLNDRTQQKRNGWKIFILKKTMVVPL